MSTQTTTDHETLLARIEAVAKNLEQDKATLWEALEALKQHSDPEAAVERWAEGVEILDDIDGLKASVWVLAARLRRASEAGQPA